MGREGAQEPVGRRCELKGRIHHARSNAIGRRALVLVAATGAVGVWCGERGRGARRRWSGV
jgi:hypothetical protein